MADARYINPYRMFNGSIIPNWLMIRKEINSSTKLVYARLGQYAGKKGIAWPQKETLAREVGLSRDMVSLCLEKLAEHRLIEVEQRPVPGRPNQSNVYRFRDHVWIHEAEEDDNDDSSEGGGGSPLPPRGEPAPPRGGTPVHPRGEPATRSLRESGEENHGRESDEACEPVAPLPADPPQPNRTLGAAASPLTSNTCAQESEEDPAGAEGCEKLNPPSPGDSVDAVVERVRREKLARLGAVITDAAKGTEEAKAKKLAKRHKPAPWQPPPGEVEELPPELQKDNTRGHLMRVWKSELQRAFPDKSHSNKWGQREYGQLQLLLDRWDADRVEDAFGYVIRNWIKLRERLFKGVGSPTPSVGVVLALHDSLVPEAQVWAKHRGTVEEYEKFGDRYDERPAELLARYLEAQKELKALGL